MTIGLLLGSVRVGRATEAVARWVLETARGGREGYELIDLTEHVLPFLAEPAPPKAGRYAFETTRAWGRVVAGFDGFVVVTPEYNGGTPGVLKNALDHLYAEWAGKPVGLAGYGFRGGSRALVQLETTVGVLDMRLVAPQVRVSSITDRTDGALTPREETTADLVRMLAALETALATTAEPSLSTGGGA